MFRRVPALVALPLVGAILSILVGSHLFAAPEPADPLATYASLMPGQPIEVLKQFSCSYPYYEYYDAYHHALYCQIKPEDGAIRLITVTTRDDQIFTVSFLGAGLRVGDLVHLWGRPDDVSKGKASFRVKWNHGVIATGRTDFWFNYQAVVHYVALYRVRPEPVTQASTTPTNGAAQEKVVWNQAG